MWMSNKTQDDWLEEFKNCGLIPNDPSIVEVEAFNHAVKNDIRSDISTTSWGKSREVKFLKKVYYSARVFALTAREYPQLKTYLNKLTVTELYEMYLANVSGSQVKNEKSASTLKLLPIGEIRIIPPCHNLNSNINESKNNAKK